MPNTNERKKKTPEEIKEKILEALNDKPLNAQEISKVISSNWSTVKNYVEELVKEKKVKEIFFGEKNIIYQNITEDTYYNIPIKAEQRKILKFIFSNAIRLYKDKVGNDIRRTDLAKLTHYINSDLKLNLPIVWYIYGPMPLMIINLQKDYSTDFIPKNSEKIKEYIIDWIKEKRRDKVRELKMECYQNSKNELYETKEKIYQKLERGDFEEISDIIFDFYLSAITFNKELEYLVGRFYEVVSGLIYLKLPIKDQMIKNKILLAFDSIWRYTASKMLSNSLILLNYSKEDVEIYIGSAIETKKYQAEEMLKELEEKYLDFLPEKVSPPELSEINEEARKTIDQWTQSEVWRE